MSMLIFFYGTVGAGKTTQLLRDATRFDERKDTKVFLINPVQNKRDGDASVVRSKQGTSRKADLVLEDKLLPLLDEYTTNILVDEGQFLSVKQIDRLRTIATKCDIDVYVYGLKTDFRGCAFPASLRLFEVADALIEVGSCCSQCERRATMNIRQAAGGKGFVFEGAQIQVGLHYKQVCSLHFTEERERAQVERDIVDEKDGFIACEECFIQ